MPKKIRERRSLDPEKDIPKRYAISIDPGVTGTGLAIWDLHPREWKRSVAPVDVRVYTPSKKFKLFQDKAKEICDHVYSTCTGHGIGMEGHGGVRMYCEYPEFRNTAAGQAVAATGSLSKLSYMCGVLGGLCWYMKTEFIPIPVSRWKGQLPKEIVKKRIIKRLGRTTCRQLNIRTHGWDAVGVGLYAKGFF